MSAGGGASGARPHVEQHAAVVGGGTTVQAGGDARVRVTNVYLRDGADASAVPSHPDDARWAPRVMGVERHRIAAVGTGSGYLVARGLVLTAARVVTRHDRVGIRFLDDDHVHPGTPVWTSAELDAALVALPSGTGRAVDPVRWGRLVGTAPDVPWEFAWFAGGRSAVEVHRGRLDPLAGAPGGHELEVARHAPWRGVAGAAVLCHGLVTAVVTGPVPGHGRRRLHAVPVEQLPADAGFRRALAGAGGSDPLVEAADLVPLLATTPDVATPLSPSSLLRGDADTVAFQGREAELRRLARWCDGADFSARLLVGPGGLGKTRLARELGRVMRERGWVTGHFASDAPPAELGRLIGLRRPLLVIVDYAETRGPRLRALLTVAARHRGPVPLRVLLVARTAGEWWRQLVDDVDDALVDVVVDELPPIAAADRQAIFTESVHGLARHVGDGAPDVVHVPRLEADRFGSPFRIVVEAFAALRADGDDAPEDVILDHERAYWSKAAKAAGVDLDPEDQRIAVAAATLCGAQDDAEALSVLKRLAGLGDDTDDGHRRRRRVAGWLRDLYPGLNGETRRYWGGLQPDLLAEHLVAQVVRGDGDFLRRVLADRTDEQAAHALRVLSRASRTRPEVAAALVASIGAQRYLLWHAIEVAPQVEDPTHLVHAVLAVVEGIPGTPDSLPELWHLSSLFPRWSAVLSRLRLAVHLAIADIHTASGVPETFDELDSLAAAMANAADDLSAAGDDRQSLRGTQLAAGLYGELATHHPPLFRPILVDVLCSLAVRQGDAGQRVNAAATVDQALAIAEELAAEDPDSHGRRLAGVLHTFALVFPKSRNAESLKAVRRAVRIHEGVARVDPGADVGVAEALNTMAAVLSTSGDVEGAEAVAGRAADRYARLVETDPEAHRPGLARALHNLAVCRCAQSKFESAWQPAEEAWLILNELGAWDVTPIADEWSSLSLLVGFIRAELGKPDPGTPLVRTIALFLNTELGVNPSASRQAANLLNRIHRGRPDEVTALWRRHVGRPLPDWLGSRLELTDETWYRYALSCGRTDVIRRLADVHHQRGEWHEAERLYFEASAAGDITAKLVLATALRQRARLPEAETLLREAAAAGDVRGMRNLALLLLERGEPDRAEPEALTAALMGDVGAMNVLGAIKSQQGDLAGAADWFRRAAKAGDPEAPNNLIALLHVKAASGGSMPRVRTR